MLLKKLGFGPAAGKSTEATLIRLANAARDGKRYAAAAALYEEALAGNPSLPHIHIQCGHMHKESGDLDAAERHYLAAKATLPGDADLELQFGHLYKVWGRPQQAVSSYANALALRPGWDEARRELDTAERAVVPPAPMPAAVVPNAVVPNAIGPAAAGSADAGPELKDAGVPSLDCYLDDISPTGWLHGWAVDRGGRDEVVRLEIVADGEAFAVVRCDEERPDVQQAKRGGLRCGFRVLLPAAVLDGKEHVLELRNLSGDAVPFEWVDAKGFQRRFTRRYDPPTFSAVDEPKGRTIHGWVLREDTETRTLRGGHDILVTCDDSQIGYIKADTQREDVAKAFGGDDHCGFQFTPPARLRRPYPQAFRFFVLPDKRELNGSPLVTSFMNDVQEAKVVTLVAEVERLYKQVTRLRVQTTQMLPPSMFSVANYDEWARRYLPALRRRVEEARVPGTPEPLVSIVMPTYRPHLPDFVAAVESVLAQTYRNWELIIADDGSQRPGLTAQIKAFQEQDRRVRAAPLARNGGISRATNAALDAARGEWIVFTDHDDLLVDVALEVMVGAAVQTGARMLYSDEDKLDPFGRFVEPAFKTDWNYRLLLCANYVCHLLMVERSVLDTVGQLDPRRDGAQDHDLVLRMSEHVPPERIHHVPEILYHWRQTASSTALATAAKSYAVEAGIAAVTDHLERVGRPALVTSPRDATWYEIEWKQDQTPAVSIIIPFRDSAETTRTCIEHILRNTDYPDYEVVLVDNWSTQPETLEFLREMEGTEPVRVLRVEENFNYSRLNNLAAASCSSPLLFLMNNDLFVQDPAWLRTVVDEMMADPTVAIVGGKFFYPNGRIQHAGVVLGVGGVATHAHVGRARDDAGYAARAIFAQEMSAVTAAGLLIRADVYKEVDGLDERELKVAFNDVDLCLKVRKAGYKVIWTPKFEAEHHESLSRGTDEAPEKEARFFHEMQTMIDRWGPVLTHDPFYNPHFLLDGQNFFHLRDPEQPAA